MVNCDVLDSQTSVRMPISRAVPVISLHHIQHLRLYPIPAMSRAMELFG